MIVTLRLRAVHAADPDALFAEAVDFREMRRAMAGLATYEGLPDGPAEQGATYVTAATLWGVLRTSRHVMHVARLDREARRIASEEHNARVRRWDHELAIDPHPQGAAWTDRVVLDAGWRTAAVALLARHVYRHRHRARGALRIDATLRRGEHPAA